jgi:AAA family ATP:ADP antiporter
MDDCLVIGIYMNWSMVSNWLLIISLLLQATTVQATSNFSSCLNLTMGVVAAVAVAVVMIHNHISSSAEKAAAAASQAAAVAAQGAAAAREDSGAAAADAAFVHDRASSHKTASSSGRSSSSSSSSAKSSYSSSSSFSHQAATAGVTGAAPGKSASSSVEQHQQQQGSGAMLDGVAVRDADLRNVSRSSSGSSSSKKQKGAAANSLQESFRILASSLEIRCLAVMSLAQGLTTNLMEFAWKSHIKILYPSPGDFTGFLGDVATWTGVVTGALMVATPVLFDRLGWRGVASATPQVGIRV